MLAYYRNNLAHLFINEAEISASLLGFLNKSDQALESDSDKVWEKTSFLKQLLNEEFVVRDSMKNMESFQGIVNFMSQRKFLNVTTNNQIKIDPKIDR